MTYTEQEYNEALELIETYNSQQHSILIDHKKIINPITHLQYTQAKQKIAVHQKQLNEKKVTQKKIQF